MINTSTPYRNLEENQKAIETQLFSTATSNKVSQLTNTIRSGREHELQYGQEAALLISDAVKSFINEEISSSYAFRKSYLWNVIRPAVELYEEELELKNKRDRKFIENPIDLVSDAVAVILTSSISKDQSVTSVCNRLSEASNSALRIPFLERETLNEDSIVFFNTVLQAVCGITDIFDIVQDKGRENILRLTPHWEAHIDELRSEINTFVDSYAPMVCKPLQHHSLISGTGGYLTMESPLLKRPMRSKGQVHPLIANFNSKNNPDYFKYINKKQNTPYVVNRKMLEVVESYYSLGYYWNEYCNDLSVIGELFKQEATNAIERINQVNEARFGEDYRPMNTMEVISIANEWSSKANDQVRRTNLILNQAEDYAEYEKIYFPVFVDFRGRCYTYASGLDYQGGELSKSMIEYANKKVLTGEGLSQLYQTLGNCLDYGKKRLDVKEQLARDWFDKNKETFFTGDFSVFFEKQEMFDEPINALAVVLELIEYTKDSSYLCGYINHRDARCSGSSIIGTLMGDIKSMTLTSVYEDNVSESLPDAYTAVADTALAMTKLLDSDASRELLEHSETLFKRSAFKFAVMTYVSYGLSDYSVRQDNRDMFIESGLNDVVSKEAQALFNNIMLSALGDAMPSCTRFLNDMKLVANQVFNKGGLVAYSNAFFGFPIVYTVNKYEERRLKARTRFSVLNINIKRKTNIIDKAKLISGFTPNMIHGQDANLLALVSDKVELDITTIHDSVGSHPNDTYNVIDAYNASLRQMRVSKPIDSIIEQLGSTIEMPYNEVDITKMNSKHSLV